MTFLCVCVFAAAGGQWEESEVVNSTQGFYSLTGLQPGTQYHLVIMHGNDTQWEDEHWTIGPGICLETCTNTQYLDFPNLIL